MAVLHKLLNYIIQIPLNNHATQCFGENTMILTPNDYKLISSLTINDEIINGKNEKVKITNIIQSPINQEIYCIPKDSISINVPNNDLYITGNHAIKINNKFHHIKCLFNQKKYNISNTNNNMIIYNISTNNWQKDTINANNIECETLCNDVLIKWLCRLDQCYPKIYNKKIIKYLKK